MRSERGVGLNRGGQSSLGPPLPCPSPSSRRISSIALHELCHLFVRQASPSSSSSATSTKVAVPSLLLLLLLPLDEHPLLDLLGRHARQAVRAARGRGRERLDGQVGRLGKVRGLVLHLLLGVLLLLLEVGLLLRLGWLRSKRSIEVEGDLRTRRTRGEVKRWNDTA